MRNTKVNEKSIQYQLKINEKSTKTDIKFACHCFPMDLSLNEFFTKNSDFEVKKDI